MKHSDHPLRAIVAVMWVALTIVACSLEGYRMVAPNYNHLIGRKFSESVYLGRKSFKVVRATDTIEELEERRTDGCILVFGVRKKDDVIEYWRVDSGPGTCYVRKHPINA